MGLSHSRPSCRTKGQHAGEVIFEFVQIWLKAIHLNGLQRDQVYSGLEWICREHGMQLRIGLAHQDASFPGVTVNLAVERSCDA